jgi:DNA-binding CsgD family transcriptional regulator
MVTTRCRTLIGRDAEIEALTACLDPAEHDSGVDFLVGEAGVGKSRLAMEVAARAAGCGFRVLTGRAAQSSNPVPLRPIAEALIGIARTTAFPDDPALAQYQPALASIVPGWNTQGDQEPEISPLILGEALLRLLTALADRGTLLVLDDLQFADPETLAIVEYLADNLGEAGAAEGKASAGDRTSQNRTSPNLTNRDRTNRRKVRCIATVQEGSGPGATMEMVRSVHARRTATVIEVRRLADTEVAEMAAACLSQPAVPEPILRRLRADCDGLPFAVEELLAAAIYSGELVHGETGWLVNDSVRTGVPTSIAESVRRRLADLGPQVSEVVTGAAVLGRQFDWTLLPGSTGVSQPEVFAALRQACDVQLIEPQTPSQSIFRFRHSLTRNAIVSNLLLPDLARRSAQAAAAICAAHPGLPGPWCELVAELRENASQPSQAAELLLEAGRRALDRGALTSAGVLLGRASAMIDQADSANPRLRADIDDALTNVHVLTGDRDQLTTVADRLLAELDAVDEPAAAKAATKALIRLRVARSLSEGDQVSSAEQQVAAARKLASGSADPELSGLIDAVAARCAIDAGDPDRAFELARHGLRAAEAAGLTGCAADAACEALEVAGRRERTRDTSAAKAVFGRAYQIACDNDLPVRQIRALHELGTIEMLEEGGSGRLCEARRLAVESGAISVTTVLDLQLANAWSLGADLRRALEAARRCQQAAHRLRLRRVEAMAISATASILATSPDHSEVEPTAEWAENVVPGDPAVLTATWGEIRVTAAIISNDLPKAVKASSTGIAYARSEPLSSPSMAWGYWALLQVICAQDATWDTIAQAQQAGAEVAFWNRGCLAYAQAVLAGRDGDHELATELAERGRQYFANCAPLWNHLLHRLVAPDAFKAGWGEPARWLRDAITELEATGYDRLASACRGALRQAGERVPRSGRGNASVPRQLRNLGITSREMDVLLLVAQGISNTDIATRLFISPKTVETHIGSLVSKTGQTGRRELVAHAARLVPAETPLPQAS